MCSGCSGDLENDETPVCLTCGGDGVLMVKPAGAELEDDLPEYVPCPECWRINADLSTENR
jgi:DnaJ-class molecular chaperone